MTLLIFILSTKHTYSEKIEVLQSIWFSRTLFKMNKHRQKNYRLFINKNIKTKKYNYYFNLFLIVFI